MLTLQKRKRSTWTPALIQEYDKSPALLSSEISFEPKICALDVLFFQTHVLHQTTARWATQTTIWKPQTHKGRPGRFKNIRDDRGDPDDYMETRLKAPRNKKIGYHPCPHWNFMATSIVFVLVFFSIFVASTNTVKTRIKEQVFWGFRLILLLIHWVFSAKSAWKYSQGVLKIVSLNKIQYCIHYHLMKSMCKHNILINWWMELALHLGKLGVLVINSTC